MAYRNGNQFFYRLFDLPDLLCQFCGIVRMLRVFQVSDRIVKESPDPEPDKLRIPKLLKKRDLLPVGFESMEPLG